MYAWNINKIKSIAKKTWNVSVATWKVHLLDRQPQQAIEQVGMWSSPRNRYKKFTSSNSDSILNLKKNSADKSQENVRIYEAGVKHQLRKTANWKGPGPDGVQGFWLNKFYRTSSWSCRTAWSDSGIYICTRMDESRQNSFSHERTVFGKNCVKRQA